MLDLIKLFSSFQPPISHSSEKNFFSAIPIYGYEPHRLGKDVQGLPSILLSIADDTNQVNMPPINLEHLSVFHNVECRISQPNGIIEKGIFTIIHCTGTQSELHSYFLQIMSAVIASLDNPLSSQDVTRTIKILVDLFRAISRPPRKSIQGLWAELFFIARSRKPITLVEAWHIRPDDRYDFSLGNQRFEIKSTYHRVRQHHFSLEQLQPPPGTEVLIVSTFVERNQAGQSLLDLLEKIRNFIVDRPDLLLHLEEVVGLTLGSGWKHALDERFDDNLAEKMLAYYSVDVVPSINPNIPPAVSNIHFLSDLTESPIINLSAYRKKGELFKYI